MYFGDEDFGFCVAIHQRPFSSFFEIHYKGYGDFGAVWPGDCFSCSAIADHIALGWDLGVQVFVRHPFSEKL